MELVDVRDSKSLGLCPCWFESSHGEFLLFIFTNEFKNVIIYNNISIRKGIFYVT